jgi:uncharacterized protein YjbI with pentapeptide repeats
MADAKKIDPFDVEALEKSLNDSATRVSTIWVSFLIFALYLLTTAATVTHRQIFLAEPLRLPVLNIDLPLWGFFFLAPILFIVFHAYVLLQVILLGRTATTYNGAVDHAVRSPPANAAIRQRLANTLFAQIFAGSERERTGTLGYILRGMAWITLAIAPILILLIFQWSFLPYHSHLATWLHRLLILIELIAIFTLWPLVLDGQRDFKWSSFLFSNSWSWSGVRASPQKSASIFGAYLGVAACSLMFSFPGEPHINLVSLRLPAAIQCDRLLPINDRLFLPEVDVVDDERLAKIVQATSARKLTASQGERTRNLSFRNFNCGFLINADLRRVDLSGSHLIGATLDFGSFDGAQLIQANLQDASLLQTQLSRTSLLLSDFRGARLTGASLQGANLKKAQFQGANLEGAALEGAFLDDADFRGALLSNARLQGASLDRTRLQGASLDGAQIQGASLRNTRLQGTNLDKSEMLLSDLHGTYVWRTRQADCTGAYVKNSRNQAIIEASDYLNSTPEIPAEPKQIADFIERSIAGISNKQLKEDVRRRMQTGLEATSDEVDAIAQKWSACEKTTSEKSQSQYESELALYLRDLTCNAYSGREMIADGIIFNWLSFEPDRLSFSAKLAQGLLAENNQDCYAAKELDERVKGALHDAIGVAASASSAISKRTLQ